MACINKKALPAKTSGPLTRESIEMPPEIPTTPHVAAFQSPSTESIIMNAGRRTTPMRAIALSASALYEGMVR